jgi:imidazolonepropionase-like amidohydrolase
VIKRNLSDAPGVLGAVRPKLQSNLPRRLAPLIVLGLLLPDSSNAREPVGAPSHGVVAFTHVNVVPMDAERVLEDQTVVTTGGRISGVGPARDVSVPAGALQIDGRGKYLMPGLADLHVHLFSADDLLPYLVSGVTTVLNMSGSPQHLQWRDEVRTGVLLGPTVFTACPIIDGIPPLNEAFLTAETPEAGRAMVQDEKRAGYDMIKLYGTLRPDVFRAILEAAAEKRIPVVGHVNRQVGALDVLKSSQAMAAHLEDLLFARFDHAPTDAELEAFADAIGRSHMTVTPNLNTNPTNIAQVEDLDAVLASTDARLLPPAAYSQWMPANNRNERGPEAQGQVEQMRAVQAILYRLVVLIHARGVRLVAGTDAAPYGIPGVSLHQELGELVDAGFSPYEALRTATRNSGDFIADEIPSAPRTGVVTVGGAADLLLLGANPLLDVSNAARIEGVALRGEWLPAAELRAREAAAFARQAAVKARLPEIDRLLEAGDVHGAEHEAEGLGSDGTTWIAEWVLMTKARKLEDRNLPAAIEIARLDTRLYPRSFSSFYLLADLLFRAGDRESALAAAHRSLALEPHCSATANLLSKIEAVARPLIFTPAGSYHVEYTNRVSGERSQASLEITAGPDHALSGEMKGEDGHTSALQSVRAGADRLWVTASTPFGLIEFRIVVRGSKLGGDWAAPFGRNGTLEGDKLS